jgi:ubiquinone/menaquinone biosynthesis C-methylase UbiE
LTNQRIGILFLLPMDPNVRRFTGFADVYNQYRPQLPSIIGDILSQLAGPGRPLRVVDIASGTGLSTRLWKDRDATVIGIEPSPDMRAIAERLQAEDQSNITFQEGISTDTGLPDASADIVTISQALHWMEPAPTFQEIARILRPRGIFAAIDCEWPPTIHPGIDEAYYRSMRQADIREQGRALSAGVRRWHKDGHFSRIKESGMFSFTKEIYCHSVEEGGTDRLIGLIKSQSSVAELLKRGLSEEEIGLSDLRKIVDATLSGRSLPWFWSYQIRLAVK